MVNLNDEDIKKFVNLLIRINNYDYQNATNGLGRFENAEDFYNYVNKKITTIEDIELLNIQLSETTSQLEKLTQKYVKSEKTLLNTYTLNEENKKTISNLKIENVQTKEIVDQLTKTKIKNEIKIMAQKNKMKELVVKYNDKKKALKKMYDEIYSQYNNYYNKYNKSSTEIKKLEELNNKYNEELNNIKKVISDTFATTEIITDLDTSISNLINKSNEYEQKYNALNISNGILQNNYDELNEKYNELFSNQTKETNELKAHINHLTEQIEQDRKKYNENMIVREIETNLEGLKPPLLTPDVLGGGGLNGVSGVNVDGIKYFDIRDKKAIEFFQKDIQLFNETKQKNNIHPINKNKQPISYSTDYMVDYMKVSDKCKQLNKLDTLQESEISEDENYIDVSKLQILKTEDGVEGYEKQELENFIKNNQNNNNHIFASHEQFRSKNADIGKIIYQKGGSKGKIEIREINGIKKIKDKFNDDYSTLTEQNIDLNNEDGIKKMKHRKYMRHIREQKKNLSKEDL